MRRELGQRGPARVCAHRFCRAQDRNCWRLKGLRFGGFLVGNDFLKSLPDY